MGYLQIIVSGRPPGPADPSGCIIPHYSAASDIERHSCSAADQFLSYLIPTLHTSAARGPENPSGCIPLSPSSDTERRSCSAAGRPYSVVRCLGDLPAARMMASMRTGSSSCPWEAPARGGGRALPG